MECVECVECVVVVVLVVHSPADFLRTLTFVVRTAGAVVRMRLLYFTPADFARTRDDTRFWPGHHGAPCDEGVGAQLARTGLGRARLFVDDVHRTVLPLVRHHHGREFLLTLFTHLSVRPAPLRGDDGTSDDVRASGKERKEVGLLPHGGVTTNDAAVRSRPAVPTPPNTTNPC